MTKQELATQLPSILANLYTNFFDYYYQLRAKGVNDNKCNQCQKVFSEELDFVDKFETQQDWGDSVRTYALYKLTLI
ncbi:hypothetical protein WA1_11720 [Scytonema hofmannii PCC 7110]|uniref:Uncharacterized protein n=1 Tax=Scytonema hofmannii PCC 7110 TaxID=128403 RepID=A0A139XDP4_9CYAN|nr:hypothetical protein WA1_11720 [Scytonema hofmannii PCC 7110]